MNKYSSLPLLFHAHIPTPFFASTGDVRPEDLEDEIISKQPRVDYQSIGDSDPMQADVVSVEITDKAPITEGQAPPPYDKSPPPSDHSAPVDKQEIS